MPQVAPMTDAAEAIDAISPSTAVARASQSPSRIEDSRPTAESRTTNPDDFEASRNQLLQRLTPVELQRLVDHCEPVWLAAGESLGHIGGPLSHVYFPVTATIALVAQADEMAGLQITLIGREGIFGGPDVGGAPVSPLNAVVRTSGWTWRLGTGLFQAELARNARLRGIVDHQLCVLLGEASQISACTRFHGVQARLARWLLTTADRVGARNFPLKARVMADMLGAKRSSVVLATTQLTRHGLICYSRGIVGIIDPRALEDSACSCYRWSHQLREDMLRRETGPQPAAGPA